MRDFDLPTEQLEHLEKVRVRYPARTSLSGALFADIISGSDLDSRALSALLYGILRYRRGVQSFARLVDRLAPEVLPPDEDGSEANRSKRCLLSWTLLALGFMDRSESHRLLDRLVREPATPLVRADALEAMAFEEAQFDTELVIRFLDPGSEVGAILSALYALQAKDVLREEPEKAMEWIRPLLTHPNSHVRRYSLETLAWCRGSRALVLSLENDEDEWVRAEVKNSLHMLDQLELDEE